MAKHIIYLVSKRHYHVITLICQEDGYSLTVHLAAKPEEPPSFQQTAAVSLASLLEQLKRQCGIELPATIVSHLLLDPREAIADNTIIHRLLVDGSYRRYTGTDAVLTQHPRANKS